MQQLQANGPAQNRAAYVTLVSNDNYIGGAEALIRSLKLSGTAADLVVMFTGGVDQSRLTRLESLGARLILTDLLDTSDTFNAAHSRDRIHGDAPFTKGEKPKFHTPLDNFAKLRLWQLTEYRDAVFIDADALVLQNIDKLFTYPEFCAAPNVYESLQDFHRMNSGVFTAKPSDVTFERMMTALDRPGLFWRRTDQTFLNQFFPDWHGLPVFYNMLQYVWLNMPELWAWREIRVLHYQYEKPWQTDHPKAEQLKPLIDLWQAYHGDGPVPVLSELKNPCD
ncbi:MAG: glycosyltransferase [Mangrovicoccus sp.]